MDLREIGWEGLHRIHLAQWWFVVNMVTDLWVP
jgi:hypothetical protein